MSSCAKLSGSAGRLSRRPRATISFALLAVFSIFAGGITGAFAQVPQFTVVRIGTGLAYTGSNVNSTSFRTDPLATHGSEQFAAYYDDSELMVLARRAIGSSTWTVQQTTHTAAISDAHRVISLAVDGDGVLHVSWGHHANDPFNYIKSTVPGSLVMTNRLPMPGIDMVNSSLTYPEFFYLPDGNLLFTYRLGGSGNGDTYVQRYDRAAGTWSRLHDPTILGRTGDTVNAYPNGMALDSEDRLHWTWCWRDEAGGPDFNHDQLYARSPDFGTTWTRMDETPYVLPITAATAELAWPVPTGSGMGNHSHMALDQGDRPLIAQLYDPGEGRRLMLTRFDGEIWRSSEITGPINWTRPLILVDQFDRVLVFHVVAGTLKMAYSSDADRVTWDVVDFVGSFRGNDVVFDRKRFDHGDGQVDIFYQSTADDSVNVVEWDPGAFAPPPPAAPWELTARPGDGVAHLSWTASFGATGYTVKRASTAGGPYVSVGTLTGTTMTDPALVNGATYYYVVAATNAVGTGAETAQVAVTPGPVSQREPLADTYARDGAFATATYGGDDRVLVKLDRTDFTRETFLRFDVNGLELAESVSLRMMPIATGVDGATTTLAWEHLAEDAWEESSLTWLSRPTDPGTTLAIRTGFVVGTPVEIDVTAAARTEAARDGLLTIRVRSLESAGGKIVHFGSRERGNAGDRPILSIVGSATSREPLFDTYAQGGASSGTNSGTEDRLLVKLDASPDTTRESFLRFDVSGLANADSATLHLVPVAAGADAASTTVSFDVVPDDTWRETGLTWTNRPQATSGAIGSVTGFAVGTPVSLDVTNAVRAEAAIDGLLTIRLASTTQGGGFIVHFGSREDPDLTDRPRLDVALPSPGSGPGVPQTPLLVEKETAGALRLTWGASCSATATEYGLYEGALDSLYSHAAVDCFDDGDDLTETLLPAAGDRYFLVVASDAAGEGSAGVDGDGVERPAGTTTCRASRTPGACP